MNLILNGDKLKNILKKKRDDILYQKNNIKDFKEDNLSDSNEAQDKNKILNSESLELKKENKENKIKNITPENKIKEIDNKENNIQKKSLNNENKNKIDLEKIEKYTFYKKSTTRDKKNINQNWENIKINLRKILDNFFFIVFMMIITLVILFIGDIQVILIDPTWDFEIDFIKLMIFIIYILEILFSCICLNDYIYSFFFWLDILSTIYILQDINFILNPLLGITENM
jgi:hypothetical protein